MSSYLTIKKKGVKLCSFSRNTMFYEALYGRAPYENWSKCDIFDLNVGYDALQEEICDYKKAIARENKALNFLTNKDDIYDALGSIDRLQEALDEKYEASMYIKFLMLICQEDTDGLEWIIQ